MFRIRVFLWVLIASAPYSFLAASSCKPCCEPAKLCPLPTCKPPCLDPCCPPMTVYNHNINPSARCTTNNNDFFVTADFLWWTVDEPETPIAIVNSTANLGPTEFSPQIGYIANNNPKWRPGFRLGFGWDTCLDGWDLYVDWTWYKNRTISVIKATATSPLGAIGVGLPFPFFVPDTKTVLVEQGIANSSWKLLYNTIDLELGRSFYISCYLTIRPSIGIKGGWLHRSFVTTYVSQLITDLNWIYYPAKSNYWGIGPRLGLNTNWKLGAGFEVFGDAYGTLLYGKNSKSHETFVFGFSPLKRSSVLSDITSRKRSWRVVPTAQLILGFGWGDCFNCNKLYFGIRAGWEVNYYWNLAGFVNEDGNQAAYTFGKNLDLAGLTIDLKLDF